MCATGIERTDRLRSATSAVSRLLEALQRALWNGGFRGRATPKPAPDQNTRSIPDHTSAPQHPLDIQTGIVRGHLAKCLFVPGIY